MIKRLRSPAGCPWDRAQNHQSLSRYMLEEAHEAYAVMEDCGPSEQLSEELGDVLLQVLLHAEIADEEDEFDFYRLCRDLRIKMIRRHPHVFGSEHHETPKAVEASWEARKSHQREGGRLGGIPRTLPALIRAERTQDRAASIGFDWEDISGVVEKLCEEASELASAREGTDKTAVENELGDLLFSMVNLARYLDISPERALHRTTDKFVKRFAHMEKRATENGKQLSDYSLSQLDEFWNEAKLMEE